MLNINLDRDFAPYGESKVRDVSRPFPSGVEVNVRFNVESLPREVRLTCRPRSSEDVMKLFVATDACRQLGARDIHLFMPYLPYARQDRVCDVGEGHALKVFGEMLNQQRYDSVTLFDVHSDVALGVIDRSRSLSNHAFVRKVLDGKEGYFLISPDAGATKKVNKLAAAIGYPGRPVQCSKYRVTGGTIESVEISLEDFGGAAAYICDDICDGGATFIKLAGELKARNAGFVGLIASHGLFTRGLAPLMEGGLDHVYTTDSFKDHESDDFLTEVQLCTIL